MWSKAIHRLSAQGIVFDNGFNGDSLEMNNVDGEGVCLSTEFVESGSVCHCPLLRNLLQFGEKIYSPFYVFLFTLFKMQ